MNAFIGKGYANGEIFAPPSKSMAHRYLICAALSKGKSVIKNISFSKDIEATISCLKEIGAEFVIENDAITVYGTDLKNIKSNTILNCNESGSTLRFFIPLVLLCNKYVKITGSEYLFTRPLGIYEEICKEQNIYFSRENNVLTLKGILKPDNFKIDGGISSQFISGLLFILPLLNGDSTIKLLPPVESRSYINMTLAALKIFGIYVYYTDENTLYIKGNRSYIPSCATVEGDYSNAAFFGALNFLGGNLEIKGLNKETLQGDSVFFEYANRLKNGYATLDVSDCPDIAPILITLSAALNGGEFVGTKRLKIKESDRGNAIAEELRKFGADILIFDNKIIVNKTELRKPTEVLKGHNDHRIVMSLAVLLTLFSGEICEAESVSKSFPDFFQRMAALGIEVRINDNN